MGRECRIIVACGKRGVGKTVETMRTIYDYIKPKYGEGGQVIRPARKALIFDVNDEFSDFWFFGERHSVKAIQISQIKLYALHPKMEVRRIRPYHDDGKRMSTGDMAEVLGIILEEFRDGLLLIEDINKYVSDSMPADLIGTMATSRHSGLEIFLHYQGCGRMANPKIVSNMNVVRFHKTNDTISRHANKFQERAEVLMLGENIINKNYEEGDERYFLYVDVEHNKIRGGSKPISKEDVEYAITEYLSNNFRIIVQPLLQKRNLSGEVVHTPASAMKYAYDNLFNKYFKQQSY
jgi:hypothetical protein